MASFWRVTAELGREKVEALGGVGIVLAIVWILGTWLLVDISMGAFGERMPQPGTYFAIMTILWFLGGLGVYLWRDPHGLRARK